MAVFSHDDKQYKKRCIKDDNTGDMVVNDSCLSDRRMLLNDDQSTDVALLHNSHNDEQILQGNFNTYMLLHKPQDDSNLDMDER